MLISLQIENFALVDRLELEFGSGFNVLTGETGAGKSIILDALDAALGGKVNNRAVRTGEERAIVEATFDLDPSLIAWLTEQQIELVDQMTLVCSRELTVSRGNVRSRSRVNGVLVNKQQMEFLRDRLVEITAQGQTVQLGQPNLQREWLDAFGGRDLMQQREVVAAAYAAYQSASQALEKRRQFEQQRLQQLDLFEYQAKELREANLSDPDELTQLEQERERLSHTVELQQQSYQVYQAIYQNDNGGEACADLLGRAESLLMDMERYDPQIQPILEMVSSALAQVEEAGRQINMYGEGLEADPDRLQTVQSRIGQLKQICRKYGPTLAEAIAYSRRLKSDLEELTGGEQSVEVLEQNFNQRQSELKQVCDQLTELRRTTAKALEELLLSELKPLAMEKVQFRVEIVNCPPTAYGADRVTFLFSPNPGEPLQPLTEIASGGEMSRFLLALKACFTQIDSVGTMVFDEIDVGVSGRVTQAIAEKLHHLGLRHQVLCVTHQPIVAAMADFHFRVSKQVIDHPGTTVTPTKRSRSKANGSQPEEAVATATAVDDVRTVVRVERLDLPQRREELAQLAGGKSDQDAIAFADSLLSQAASSRSTAQAKYNHPNHAPAASNGSASSAPVETVEPNEKPDLQPTPTAKPATAAKSRSRAKR
ncbi:DNA repair protein RecN [Oscillatoria sp. FACHB-1407]|uniref:DNA repair protein RecN n=1 Tax=Oscillatoria sp. FACHB-1407 TaxID=2692847 RepID=UPI00168737A3|nr:DNA repair protein RecN [Oscillatoria sp. FACHB-1407]MBD2464118.1 DNA repair protein RecN [Oscillatoria sp. FACHB-1407]